MLGSSMKSLLLLAVIAMTFCSCVSYECVSPSVHGIVLDATSHKPLGGADVQLIGGSSITTADDGIFEIPARNGLTIRLPLFEGFPKADLIIEKPFYYPSVFHGYFEKYDSPVFLTKTNPHK